MQCILFISNLNVCSCSHPSEYCDRHRFEDSTRNLGRHIDNCDPDDTPSTQQITAFASGTTYSPARFRYLLAMWCSRHYRPFNIVKDEELLDIFTMLYARIDVPHPVTVSRDVKEIFRISRENISKVLQVCSLLYLMLFNTSSARRTLESSI
jgi:hypothetical protein